MGLYNANEVITNEVLSRHNVYGVTFDGINSEGKPIYNAIDQKWVPATTTDPGVDTWKDIAPFNVKKCITYYDASEIHKRKVLAYEGEDIKYYSLLLTKVGDRMVEFPLGYYYRPDTWTFIVSPDPIEGFKPSPACDLGNGTILNGFRLSEFDLCEVSSVPRSIPWKALWTYVDIKTLNDALNAKGQYLETFGAWCWINILRLIKQQNLDSQKVNGKGIHGINYKFNGITTEDKIQGLDGYVGINDDDNVRTLGLQNFYGHVWNFLSNVIVRSASKVWIKKDFTNLKQWPTYSDAISSGWEELDVSLPGISTNYCISELACNSTEPWALYPSKFGENDAENIGDTCWVDEFDPFSVVCVGGSAGLYSANGALSWSSYDDLSCLDVSTGGRSLEIF